MLVVTAPRRLTMLGWDPRWDIIFSSDIRDLSTSLLVNGFIVLTATRLWSSSSFIPGRGKLRWLIKGKAQPTHSHCLQNSSKCPSSDLFPNSEPLLWELYAGVVLEEIDLRRHYGQARGLTGDTTWSWREPLLKSIDLGSPFIKRFSSASDNISLAL